MHDTPMITMPKKSTEISATASWHWLAAAVLLLALGVRLWGIRHDLPYSYYGDEAHFVERALAFGSGDLNPHWFHKPAFYMYLLFLEYGVYCTVGLAAGWWSSVHDFAVSYVLNPGPFLLIGRLTTVAFGVGSVWGVYRIGMRHFTLRVGIVAALLLALTAGHVAASRDVKADVPAAFFGVWSMYFLLNHLTDRSRKSILLAALFAGMGAATKYYTIVMLVPILVGAIWGRSAAAVSGVLEARRRFNAVFLVVLVFWATYFVCSPFNFLDARGRERTFGQFEGLFVRVGELVHADAEVAPDDFIGKRVGLGMGIVNYGRVILLPEGMGAIVGSLGLCGVLALFLAPCKRNLLFLLYPLIFAMISIFLYPGYAEPRHQAPLYPFLAVAGAILIGQLAGLMEHRSHLTYVALVLGLCLPAIHIERMTRELSKEETRTASKSWIESNIPCGAKIVIDEDGPPLQLTPERLEAMLGKAKQADANGQFTAHYDTYLELQLAAVKGRHGYDLREIRCPWWRETLETPGTQTLDSEYDRDMGNPLKPVGVEDYDYYVRNGYQYAVVNSSHYGRYYQPGKRARERYPWFAAFYDDLFRHGELEHEFQPGAEFRGPVVKIFRFRPRRFGMQVAPDPIPSRTNLVRR